MFKRIVLTLLLIIWSVPAIAELVDTAWVRSYNGEGNYEDFPSAVGADLWGNVYVTGYSYGDGTERDYATLKYNPRGDKIWVRRYNGPGNSDDWADAMAVDLEGNVYVTGRSTGIGTDWDCATMKYYPNGDTAWLRRYNGSANESDYGWAIVVDDSGYVYVAGATRIVSGDGDYLSIKYNPDGDTAWVRVYRGQEIEYDWARAIAVDGNGNVYVTGTSRRKGAPHYLTLKYHPNGEIAWARTYNGAGGMAVVLDDSGNVYVSGLRDEYLLTIKYDPDGNEIWAKSYTEIGTNNLYGDIGLTVDHVGTVYLCWNGQPDAAGCYYLVIKYHPNGNIHWVREHHATYSYASATDIAVGSRGDIYVTGVNDHRYFTVKYNPQGDPIWSQEYNAAGGWQHDVVSLALDVMGNVHVAGWGNKNNGDYATIKYAQFWYSRGDVNQDDEVSIVDVVYLLNYLFKSGPAPVPYLPLGDADGDADIDISDILYLIVYIFEGGPKPCL